MRDGWDTWEQDVAIKDYTGDDIVVHWDARRCIHTGICTRGLPEVFDVTRRPWITLEDADADRVAELVERCPTGALRYRRLPDGPSEQPATPTTVVPMRNGPLYLRGDLQVTAPDGTVVTRETRIALCRCGATANPPFCDSSHTSAGFRSADPVDDVSRADAASPAEVCDPQEFD